MKKAVLIFVLMFSVSAVVISCKENKKEQSEESEMIENHGANEADMALNAEYQCQMNCEEGKTYDSPGVCPVCAMELKKVEKEGEHTHDDGATHEDHDSDEDYN